MTPSSHPCRRLGELVQAGVIGALGLALPACADGDDAVRDCARSDDPDCAAAVPVVAEAGFIELGEADYEIQGQPLTISAARFFYSFQPAESRPASAPLLVLVAGGPATSAMYLLGWNLGPYALFEAGEPGDVEPNPHRFTDLVNLLYIDSRNAGFSYQWIDDPSSLDARLSEFTARQYNAYRDGADLLEVLLSFLEDHPQLERAPIYFLAESCGALRTTLALNFLLFPTAYATGDRPFRDAALGSAIDRFVERRFGAAGAGPETIAEQFRGQILIQPVMAGSRHAETAGLLFEQPGSVIEQLATEVGADFIPCREQAEPCDPYANAHAFLFDIDRSRFDYREPEDWLRRTRGLVDGAATRESALELLLGVDPTGLGEVFARREPGAYRFGDLTHSVLQPRGDLEEHFGALEPWDAYFVSLNSESLAASLADDAAALEADTDYPGFMPRFFENLRYVPTFLTRAVYDLSVYSPAWVPTLESYPEVERAAVVTGDYSEEILVHLADGTTRSIVSPRYQRSGHSVSRDEPAQLHQDVARFLEQTLP